MKRPTVLTFCLLTLLSANLSAQGAIFEWGHSFGGSEGESITAKVVDAQGAIYITGTYRGIVDFDPGPENFYLSSNGEDDIYVQKLDAAGNLVWALSFGGNETEANSSITLDSENNLYLTGSFRDFVDFDPTSGFNTLSSNGDSDMFIMKMDMDGNVDWTKSIGSSYGDFPNTIKVDAAGDLLITGRYGDNVDFDPGDSEAILSALGGWDVFVLKLDSEANFIWVKTVGDTSFDTVQSLVTDASNNIYIAGTFLGDLDLDPGPEVFEVSSEGLTDFYILKLNSEGQFVWAESYGGTKTDICASLMIDHNNNLLAAGEFQDVVNFSADSNEAQKTSLGDYDGFLMKLSLDGTFDWVETLHSEEIVYVRGISLDQSNNYYITGEFNGTMDVEIGNGITSFEAVTQDIYVFKLEDSGGFLWGETIEGIPFKAARTIHVDEFNNIILTGVFSSSVDFDPGNSVANLTSNGLFDYFVMKWSQDFSNAERVPSKELGITAFPNPVNDLLTIEIKDNLETKFELFSGTGQLILSQKLSQQKNEINLTGLAAGLYILHFENGEYFATEKIYKN